MAKTQVVVQGKTAVITMDEHLRNQIAAQQKMLSKISTSAKFISLKGGQISIDGKIVPGAKTEVIVLAFMGERTYFPGEFDPDIKQSPLCYSYFDAEDDETPMAPHKAAATPQAKLCEDCQWNEWKSAAKGKGKACRESIRVALIPNIKDISKAQVWHTRIPITSVPMFKTFVSDVLGSEKPVWAVVVELSVTPDAKTFFKVNWDIKRGITEQEATIASAKAVAAQRDISFEYPKPEDKAPPAPVKALKNKRVKA